MGKEKLKILLPALREKKRYIKFQVLSEEPITYSEVEQAIWNVALDFFGEIGMSKTSLWVIKNLWNEKKQIGVIKCNNKSVQQMIALLGLIARLGDSRVIIKILKISGTIKSLNLSQD